MSKIIRYYRHSETSWNEQQKLQGWLDSPLTPRGIAQARAVKWQPDIVFSSDLQRAITSAQWMFPAKEIQQCRAIREIYLADWQGRPIAQLQQDENYQAYSQHPASFLAQQQESFEEVTARMLHFHRQVSALPYEKIAVVTHGMALACLLTALHGDEIENVWRYMLGSAQYEEISLC